MKYHVSSPVADVFEVPDTSALRGKFETQLVFGESFTVEEEKNGWCKGKCLHDDYAGYIESKHLTKQAPAPTHVVTAAATHVYRDDTMKSPMVTTLSFGSQITVTCTGLSFAKTTNGWVYLKHIAPMAQHDKDYVATARKFLETP